MVGECILYFTIILNLLRLLLWTVTCSFPGRFTFTEKNVYFALIVCESESEVTQSCLTLCDPMDGSLPGSSVHGISQARMLEWVAPSFSREFSLTQDLNPRSPALQADSLPTEL